MTAATTPRSELIDEVATHLLPRASILTRLLLASGARSLTRTEGGVLSTLFHGPRRVTELAETEVLAQPTVSQLIDRLERRGLVTRTRAPHDGRVVLVSITDAGRAELERMREGYRAQLRRHFDDLPDEELASLAAATETLGRVVDALQSEPRP